MRYSALTWSRRPCAATTIGGLLGATLRRNLPTTSVIVGGGGHGLATAYYLAKELRLCDIAVIEKGWIGWRQRRTQHHRSSAPTIRDPAILPSTNYP